MKTLTYLGIFCGGIASGIIIENRLSPCAELLKMQQAHDVQERDDQLRLQDFYTSNGQTPLVVTPTERGL